VACARVPVAAHLAVLSHRAAARSACSVAAAGCLFVCFRIAGCLLVCLRWQLKKSKSEKYVTEAAPVEVSMVPPPRAVQHVVLDCVCALFRQRQRWPHRPVPRMIMRGTMARSLAPPTHARTHARTHSILHARTPSRTDTHARPAAHTPGYSCATLLLQYDCAASQLFQCAALSLTSTLSLPSDHSGPRKHGWTANSAHAEHFPQRFAQSVGRALCPIESRWQITRPHTRAHTRARFLHTDRDGRVADDVPRSRRRVPSPPG
jgi:hypothetical protein